MARDGLSTYRSRRDPAKTPEPVPSADEASAPASGGNSFVIQEHHATALHWDFRLERDGVLVSWAVPKGLPRDPKSNRLAVHTEDHPLEYGTFEGHIPEGEYGGGNVILWDHGTYECEKWSDREVKVVLHGSRVSGRYVLFRTGDGDKDWMVHRVDPAPEGYAAMPALIRPMLATARGTLPDDDDAYGYEFKWDGVRAVTYTEGGRARVLSRNDNDVTASYPELRAMAESLGAIEAVLDGEIVAFDASGRPSFAALQKRMHVTTPAQVRRLAQQTPATYLVFDVLHLEGHSLLDEPYAERRRVLDALALSGPSWQTTPYFAGNGAAVLAASQQQGLEGVVAKRLDSRYLAGKRSDLWLKVKNIRTQSVVIGGWQAGEGRRAQTIGSLLVGIPDSDGLRYVGRVGSGLDEQELSDLALRLSSLATDTTPFVDATPPGAHWVRPQLVAEVTYGEWTPDGRMRHPVWRGLRNDIKPSEVERES